MIRQDRIGFIVGEFGYGDICISGGSNDFCDENQGCLLLLNQESQEIGSISKRAGKPFYPDREGHIKFTFIKTASIDELIRQLEITKADMLERGIK